MRGSFALLPCLSWAPAHTYAPFKILIIEKGLDCDQKNRPTMSEILITLNDFNSIVVK